MPGPWHQPRSPPRTLPNGRLVLGHLMLCCHCHTGAVGTQRAVPQMEAVPPWRPAGVALMHCWPPVAYGLMPQKRAGDAWQTRRPPPLGPPRVMDCSHDHGLECGRWSVHVRPQPARKQRQQWWDLIAFSLPWARAKWNLDVQRRFVYMRIPTNLQDA